MLAVIVVVPTSIIVTAPVLEFTVAIDGLLDVYVIGNPEILDTPVNV